MRSSDPSDLNRSHTYKHLYQKPMTMFNEYARWIDKSRSACLRYLSLLGAVLLLLVSAGAQSRSAAPQKGTKAGEQSISRSADFRAAGDVAPVERAVTKEAGVRETATQKTMAEGNTASADPTVSTLNEEVEALKAQIEAMGPDAVTTDHDRLKQLQQELTRLQTNNQPR